jgi:NAD(P)H-dependent FMN reductase
VPRWVPSSLAVSATRPAFQVCTRTIGSTRPGRNGEAVAKWVYKNAQKRNDAEFELVDIKDFNLPLLDEAVPPSMGQHEKSVNELFDQVIAWSSALKALR